MEIVKKDPILLLIDVLSQELRQEIVLNEDSTGFWLKAQSHIFENSIVSIRENIAALSDAVAEDRDLYNYMSALVFRMFSQPCTTPALEQFKESFNKIVGDSFFRDGFGFTTASMSNVEVLLLFISVHRNQIQLAFFTAEHEAEQKQLRDNKEHRGRRG